MGNKRDTRFRPGQSGNPKGRPKGALNKVTLAVQELLDGEAEAITRKAIKKAKEGDMAAIRLCIERISSPVRDRLVEIDMPPIESVDDATKAIGAIVGAVASGHLTRLQGNEIAKLVGGYVQLIKANEFEERLRKLEGELEQHR